MFQCSLHFSSIKIVKSFASLTLRGPRDIEINLQAVEKVDLVEMKVLLARGILVKGGQDGFCHLETDELRSQFSLRGTVMARTPKKIMKKVRDFTCGITFADLEARNGFLLEYQNFVKAGFADPIKVVVKEGGAKPPEQEGPIRKEEDEEGGLVKEGGANPPEQEGPMRKEEGEGGLEESNLDGKNLEQISKEPQ